MRDIAVGKTYRHFSGNYYTVICIAIDSTSGEEQKEVVVYESLDKNHTIWTRPVELFNEEVDKTKYPNIDQKYKFEPISDEIDLGR